MTWELYPFLLFKCGTNPSLQKPAFIIVCWGNLFKLNCHQIALPLCFHSFVNYVISWVMWETEFPAVQLSMYFLNGGYITCYVRLAYLLCPSTHSFCGNHDKIYEVGWNLVRILLLSLVHFCSMETVWKDLNIPINFTVLNKFNYYLKYFYISIFNMF